MSIVTNIPSVDDYRAADRAGKSNMRATATTAIMAAIDALDIDTATAWRTAMAAWTESNTRSTTATTDWSALASVRVATLRRAADMIASGAIRPTGVPDDVELTFDSDATADDDRAARIAADPIRRSEKSDMRSAVASVVESMDAGAFYTVADVAHMIEKSVDTYAGRTVSHGAVRNVLESNKVSGITFVPATSDNVNGCRKS